MTDEEIIKALEVHGNEKFDNCEGCPYLDGDSCEGFPKYSKPYRDVLDLINRQKAEITNLLEERETLLKECKKCGRKHGRTVSKLQKEIERLQAEVDKWKCALKNGCELSKCINKGWVMNEAYREFAERLLQKCAIDRGFAVMSDDAINNTLDELTGGANNEEN